MTQREKPKVLVIDDSSVDRMVLEKHLTNLDCDVKAVKGGIRGITLHTKEHFDLMFIDIMMPLVDGCDTAQLVQAASDKDDIPPMIAVTGVSDPAEQKKILSIGMSAVINKPASEVQLSSILKQFINWPPAE